MGGLCAFPGHVVLGPVVTVEPMRAVAAGDGVQGNSCGCPRRTMGAVVATGQRHMAGSGAEPHVRGSAGERIARGCLKRKKVKLG